MSEHETIRKVKDKQGILSRIQDIFTLGYDTKEDLRELDKKLRDIYYEDLNDMRKIWGDAYLEAMNSGHSASNSGFKKVLQVLDRVAETVRHADYGYAGLMDRKGHIREEELARTYNYDKALGEDIENLKATVEKTYSGAEAEDWSLVEAEVKKMKGLLLSFESKWKERERRFRPLEV